MKPFYPSSLLLAALLAPLAIDSAPAEVHARTIRKEHSAVAPVDVGTPDAPGTGKGAHVLRFCQGRVGTEVGDGQCASLALLALQHAGAKGMGRDFPCAGDYAWGNLIAVVSSDASKPDARIHTVCGGDIIQFRIARFEGRSPGGGTYWMQLDHHTAVVESTDVASGTIRILHQNWSGKKTVRRDVLQLADLKRGWLRIYRPAGGP